MNKYNKNSEFEVLEGILAAICIICIFIFLTSLIALIWTGSAVVFKILTTSVIIFVASGFFLSVLPD